VDGKGEKVADRMVSGGGRGNRSREKVLENRLSRKRKRTVGMKGGQRGEDVHWSVSTQEREKGFLPFLLKLLTHIIEAGSEKGQGSRSSTRFQGGMELDRSLEYLVGGV